MGNSLKERFAGLLLLGGILAFIFSRSAIADIPVPIFSAVGGFFLTFSFMTYTAVYGGKVWGIRVKSSTLSKMKMLCSIIGLVVGGFGTAAMGLNSVLALLDGNFVDVAINLGVYIVLLLTGGVVAKLFGQATLAKEDTASVLGQLQIFQDIDEQLGYASNFVVGFEGVALFSQTEYCYAVYRYEDYALGELSFPKEVALVGTYFVQRYNNIFDFKVDQEIIPGEPGRTVVAVGAGGIAVGRIKGTRDQRLFRSYIFKRRDPKSLAAFPVDAPQQPEKIEQPAVAPQQTEAVEQPATVFCAQCGKQALASEHFCSNCGQDLFAQ